MHGLHLFAISYDHVLLGWYYLLGSHKFDHISCRGIGGCVINEDHMIVGILLHEDGVHVIDVSVINCVIVGWHDHTEWKFFVLANLILLFIIGSLRVNGGIRGV